MVNISAHDVCHQLLYQLRLSNLHFALSETPHSVQIMLRKRFLKDSNGPATKTSEHFSLQDYENLKHQNSLLISENKEFKEQIEELQVLTTSSKETVDILEEKISKVEASALKSFEARNIETSTLKSNLKNLKIELETSKRDLNARNKTIKEKEKENNKLDQKNKNLAENINILIH